MLLHLRKNFAPCFSLCVCVCVCVCVCEWVGGCGCLGVGVHSPPFLYGADCQMCVKFTQTCDRPFVMKWLTLQLVLTFIS